MKNETHSSTQIQYGVGNGRLLYLEENMKNNKIITAKSIENEQCSRELITIFTMYDMCTIDSNLVGYLACKGDSGGSLMSLYKNQWYLNGLSSEGFRCRQKYPEVHTNIVPYLNWILQTMK